jgi:hypothetical protein
VAHLGTWIVTETTPTEPRRSIHFVCAASLERAIELVALRTGIHPETLSPVPLRVDASPVPPRRRIEFERYLGPLEQFSPFLRDACDFCRGHGRVIGSRPPRPCPTCGGTGFKTTR